MTRTLAYPLIVLLPCLALQVHAEKPTPGMYSITTNMESDAGVPLQTDTLTECLTEEDVQNDAFVGVQDGAQNCAVSNHSVDAGRMAVSMVCETPQGKMTMKTNGTYHATGFSVTSNIEFRSGDTTSTVKSTGVGKRIGDC